MGHVRPGGETRLPHFRLFSHLRLTVLREYGAKVASAGFQVREARTGAHWSMIDVSGGRRIDWLALERRPTGIERASERAGGRVGGWVGQQLELNGGLMNLVRMEVAGFK